ncbi:polysaccharide pyruvyl transferase family protein [Sporosarcina sp. HYO08]|uniref:polysaccharide pyruvyl transferase family protein n=1 Tax=Sporosarcina sp. HYO08 TaxID=1759557 RepID=UPI00079CB356|nr:polysaccharide pyruvyl transferase family protein [Sporosarcina sp. HYO08]KXH86086.1 hypothetical protein AU377_14780 [Sporosarcina sp. HYO08]
MKYIIIVGGELHNKGAQAMTYTVVDQVKKNHPNKKVVLFSEIYNDRDKLEEKKLNFDIFYFPARAKMDILGFGYISKFGLKEYLKLLIKGTGVSSDKLEKIKNIIKNADAMIDISGYALSSQRGYFASMNYLYNIMIAKKYSIPMNLLPQSFGPFHYTPKEMRKLKPLIKEYLEYPEVIFAREEDGIENLKTVGIENVRKSFDIVLQGDKEYDVSNIFKIPSNSVSLEVTIEKNSIGIIPNQQIMSHGSSTELFEIYNSIIDFIIKKGKRVYLINHSTLDLEICKKIKASFSNEDNVILIEQELNCIEINSVLKKLDFIIASRYHAIVHSYKLGIPALVFGWAVKYKELLKAVNQEQYLFDVRESIEQKKLTSALDHLIMNYNQETVVIEEKLNNLNKHSVFEDIKVRY